MKNTITEFAKIQITKAITYIVYSIIGLIPFIYAFKILLKTIINKYDVNNLSYIGLLYILIFVTFFTIGLLMAVIIIYLIKAIKNQNIITYYKKNKIEVTTKLMIPYDYKLWLTAPKNTYHPISFKLKSDDDETHITDKIFTNCDKYNYFPKFKTPQCLLARNYVKNYAVIGYDKNKNEYLIIGFEKPIE